MSAVPLLVGVLRDPAAMAGLNLAQWELLLRQAMAAKLSASLHALACEHQLLDAIPAAPRAHLEWAGVQAARHVQAVDWETRQIGAALAGIDTPQVLLKGGAYTASGLRAGRGRIFSDIDLLVSREALPEVESALMRHGWISSHTDDYDQRYYRTWMHEIPPMVHAVRGTSIDVHHAILPLSARARPDSRLLIGAAVAVAGAGRMRVLAPVDMVLHSATHLFYNGEFERGLRDLVDIDSLLRQFSADPAFWPALAPRAAQLQLARPLFYALRHAHSLLETPVPDAVMAALAHAAPARPVLALMDGLLRRALLPRHPSCQGSLSGLALFLLYVRGNWLRMPPLLLARHLFHKAFLSPRH